MKTHEPIATINRTESINADAVQSDRVSVESSQTADSMDFSFLIGLSQVLKDKEISYKQYFLLGRLSERGPLAMKEIADLLCIKDAAVTGLIDRLEEKEGDSLGYVRRVPSQKDRRKTLVEITEAGSEVVSAVRKVTRDLVSELVSAHGEGRSEDAVHLSSDLKGMVNAL